MIARLTGLGAALLLAIASVVLLGAAPAHACRCVFGDLPTQADRADAVFVGSFARRDRTVADRRITFDIATTGVYRGRVPTTVTVRAPYASATCGLAGIPAGEPVVWFTRQAGSGMRSDLCSGTAPLTPKLTRQLERVVGPAAAPTTDDPTGEAPSDGATGVPGDSPGPDGVTGPGATGEVAGDDSADASGGDEDLPWWAWTLGGLVAGLAVAVVARRRRT